MNIINMINKNEVNINDIRLIYKKRKIKSNL